MFLVGLYETKFTVGKSKEMVFTALQGRRVVREKLVREKLDTWGGGNSSREMCRFFFVRLLVSTCWLARVARHVVCRYRHHQVARLHVSRLLFVNG